MAAQVRGISQNPITFEGSAEYEKQMFGVPTATITPYQQDGPLWNLYKVMTDLLNDGRFTEYGGILLAEYYKGYDTIELMNVGAGGAYFTCDGDLYLEDKTGDNAHVWHDGNNGMANRWVAYLFSAPSTNYTITSTNLCPRSIHIGRHVGTIDCSVAGRICEIVVSDFVDESGTQLNVLDGFVSTASQAFGKNVIVKNLNNQGAPLFTATTAVEFVYIHANRLHSGNTNNPMLSGNNIYSVMINCKRIGTISLLPFNGANLLNKIVINGVEECDNQLSFGSLSGGISRTGLPALQEIYLTNIEKIHTYMYANDKNNLVNFKKLYIGYKTNDKNKSVFFETGYSTDRYYVEDVELQDGWNKPLTITAECISSYITEDNIYNHILCRLKADEPGCGIGITISLGVWSKLTSQQSLDKLAELTDIYGYKFI